MKTLPLFCVALLVGACTSTPTLTPPQLAVSAYLKKTLDDPASYEPARWGKAVRWRQTDADTTDAREQVLLWMVDARHAQSYIDSCRAGTMFRDRDSLATHRDGRSGMAAAGRADKRGQEIKRLRATVDTSQIGTAIWHSFRAKNKIGALVLDSARFTVLTSGAVTPMR